LASLSITVAAYSSLDAASADWDDVDRHLTDQLNPIDATLIEQSGLQVTVVHRCLSVGWAHGSVAGALVGRLSPTALLGGAIAGGVGRRALTFVSNGLSRDAVNELGRVLESGRFVTLAVASEVPDRPQPATAPGPSAWPASLCEGPRSSCVTRSWPTRPRGEG
jgi:uncharacterized membrane protein